LPIVCDAKYHLFKAFVDLLLQLLFEFIAQFAFPAFHGMEEGVQHTMDPAALPLEQPAYGTAGKVNDELCLFLDGQRGMLPFLYEPGCMTTII
jgi:hypothetical protein